MNWDIFHKRWRKANPKKVPETDAIFEQLERVLDEAKVNPRVLRISMDAKAKVNVGEFSRGGKSRIKTHGEDHDFKPDAHVTPVGLLLPERDELTLYGILSKVTSDCLADCIEHWWNEAKPRFSQIETLLINMDNGPECHSRRTQFMYRMVEFSAKSQLTIRLAYYPPYHSKYNPIERCWGILENHWNGSLLDSVDTVIRFASTMTWKGIHPVVNTVTKIYETGVSLTKDAMDAIEARIQRFPELGKWFVDILPTKNVTILSS
jgi:hypothetical protein